MTQIMDNMDRAIAPEKIRRRKIKAIAISATTILLILLCWSWLKGMVTPSLKRSTIKIATVERGDVRSSVTASGIVEAEYENLILAPFAGNIQTIIKTSGSHVSKGDTILILDQQPMLEKLANLQDQLKLDQNSYHQNQLNASNQRLELTHQLEVKKLKITDLKTKLHEEKLLLEVGGISEEKIRNTKQQLELAQKELELAIQQNAIKVEKITAEKEALELRIRIKQRELQKAQLTCNAAFVTAQQNGIVISVTGREGQTVGSGAQLVRISDLSTFKLTGKIADSNAEKLHSGNKVIAINDDTHLEGTIGNIRPEVDNGMIKFDVFLKQSNHKDLRPNLNMELQVITKEKQNTLRLPDGPFYDGSKQLEVFKVDQDIAQQTSIKVGISNFEYVEVLSGLEEGDEVIISDISKVSHIQQVKIKP
ncbi:efflux RND transporter periplasmic adaptor subunit [Puteibacter caeruleilacunae]|nr:efflux RND transporter periplasmic adaptor subunit [Puteibacter caeruleilacunae]